MIVDNDTSMMQASVERGGQDSIEEDKERDEHLGSTR